MIPTPFKKFPRLFATAAIFAASTALFAMEPAAKPRAPEAAVPAPAPVPAPTTVPAPAPVSPAKDAVQNFQKQMADPPDEDLGDDPLGAVADKMTEVHADLSDNKTDKPVQDKQRQIVADIDQILRKLQPKGGGTGTGNTPDGGRKRSIIVSGDPEGGDLHGVDPRGREWAQLPPKERERILQSRTEGFPPGYEALLQSYYQRLAQEKPAETVVPATAPASK
jgi:outer membrane receptor protein involved in Fe transport